MKADVREALSRALISRKPKAHEVLKVDRDKQGRMVKAHIYPRRPREAVATPSPKTPDVKVAKVEASKIEEKPRGVMGAVREAFGGTSRPE